MKRAYQVAVVGWGMQPSEFWRLHPTEFWWLMEARAEAADKSGLTTDHKERLYQMLLDMKGAK